MQGLNLRLHGFSIIYFVSSYVHKKSPIALQVGLRMVALNLSDR
ncbi:hypothetical protein THIOSC13_1360004 [uncultured Thiomicrorhabdus sp.]